jgi:hypothetical protein
LTGQHRDTETEKTGPEKEEEEETQDKKKGQNKRTFKRRN